MPKRIDLIYEMVFFFRRMPEKDKTAFRSFLEKKKSSELLLGMFKTFDKCDPTAEPKGLIKRLLTIRNGKDYRMFVRLKNLLFEFEITSKRLNYYRNKDNHEHLLIHLKQKFLAAQMLTEKDAYLTSIEFMVDTFKTAEKFEFLEIQKSSAENLSSFYFMTGDKKTSIYYLKKSQSVSRNIASYEEINLLFENETNKISCCPSHDISLISIHDKLRINRLKKISWMISLLDLVKIRQTKEHSHAFKSFLALYREIKNNPGVYPLYFIVTITRYLLEDLYKTGRYRLIGLFAKKIYVLDHFPVYRRLPLIRFFLYFLLKTKNYRILDLLIEDISREKPYSHFLPFIRHFQKIELLYHLVNNEADEVLKKLNRHSYASVECALQDFDVRVIEILALCSMKPSEILFDKLESLRRYHFRHPECLNSAYCCITFERLRSYILHDEDIVPTSSDLEEFEVYDLAAFIHNLATQIFDKKYNSTPIDLSKAAES